MNTKNEEPKYIATLVRGQHYGTPRQSFRPGERHVVSEELMMHMDANAVHIRTIYDPLTGEMLGEPVAMFDFQPFDGPEPAGHRFPTAEELEAAEVAKAARARSRRIALAKAEIDGPPARTRSRSRAAA